LPTRHSIGYSLNVLQQITQQLTADEYRRARLMHVKREALHRAAIEALSAVLASFDRRRNP
jgi:hypothetical protein